MDAGKNGEDRPTEPPAVRGEGTADREEEDGKEAFPPSTRSWTPSCCC